MLSFDIAGLVFYISFVLFYVIGGTLALYGIVPYRPYHLSFLPFLLMPLYGIKFDLITKLFLLFALVIFISAAINRSSFMQVVMFMRYVVTPYAMYYLATIFIKPKNIGKIINLCLAIGMIQLPIVVIQRLLYHQLITPAVRNVQAVDFMFGSFNVSGDPSLSFFLMGLILFLLCDRKHNYFVKNRMAKAIWFSLTIFLSNSVLSHLLTIGIWGYYLLQGRSLKSIIQVGLVTLAAIGTLSYLNMTQSWTYHLSRRFNQMLLSDTGNMDTFLEGRYSRSAGVIYFLTRPVSWFGDGPSRYYDAYTRTYLIGVTGQALTVYAEAGLMGLLLSYLILFALARKDRSANKLAWPYFLIASFMAIISNFMNDASIMLTYNIFLSTGMIRTRPPRQISSGSEPVFD